MVCKIKGCEACPIVVHLHINGIRLTMQVDTGGAVSTISEQTQKKFFPKALLQRTSIKGTSFFSLQQQSTFLSCLFFISWKTKELLDDSLLSLFLQFTTTHVCGMALNALQY